MLIFTITKWWKKSKIILWFDRILGNKTGVKKGKRYPRN